MSSSKPSKTHSEAASDREDSVDFQASMASTTSSDKAAVSREIPLETFSKNSRNSLAASKEEGDPEALRPR